jgi:transposase
MKKKEFLGIDVSKEKLDTCIYTSREQAVFENSRAGLKKLMHWLEKQSVNLEKTLICFEHTGRYDVTLQVYCEEQKLDYVKVSGLQVKRSLGIKRGKNDRVDALRLAEYVYLHQEKINTTHLASTHLIRLKALLSLRSRLVRTRAAYMASIKQDKSCLDLKISDPLIQSQQKLIHTYSKQIQKVEDEIIRVIDQDPVIKQQHQLATSVVGIGNITASYMIVYTNCFKSFKNSRKFACYAGSAPFEHTSGSSIHGKTRISNYANKLMKTLLTNAALSAIKHDAQIKLYYQRKVDEGKPKKLVINNVRNKLIGRVFATINRGTPYVKLNKFAA